MEAPIKSFRRGCGRGAGIRRPTLAAMAWIDSSDSCSGLFGLMSAAISASSGDGEDHGAHQEQIRFRSEDAAHAGYFAIAASAARRVSA